MNGIIDGLIIGHVIPGICDSAEVRMKLEKKVDKAPPIYPSHVFLGDSAMSCLVPKKYPNKYANISLEMMSRAGTM